MRECIEMDFSSSILCTQSNQTKGMAKNVVALQVKNTNKNYINKRNRETKRCDCEEACVVVVIAHRANSINKIVLEFKVVEIISIGHCYMRNRCAQVTNKIKIEVYTAESKSKQTMKSFNRSQSIDRNETTNAYLSQ